MPFTTETETLYTYNEIMSAHGDFLKTFDGNSNRLMSYFKRHVTCVYERSAIIDVMNGDLV